MDQISRLRFKNLLDQMLVFCDKAEEEEEKAVLLRIGVVCLNKLRIHASVDYTLTSDVREMNSQVKLCKGRSQLVDFMWDEVLSLLKAYREEFA